MAVLAMIPMALVIFPRFMSVRVRFAPSPTGYLHIGGARTALFNWLYARHTGGVFVLRIEDTDEARNTQEAVDVILDGLKWLGLDWDEGPTTGDSKGPSKGEYGPYFQSQRGHIYKERVAELIAKGAAYEKEGAIRFRMQREAVLIPDLVVGEVRRELTDREAIDPDFVIVRSDGQPVFHLVNVIDDMEMKITHVIRGEDHLSNTAKHIALFKAFGAEPPAYAHIPLILNPDGSKMSKRDTGASLRFYVDGGYVPEAVVNYLYLLGWSPKENREIMPLAEVIGLFDIPQILRNNAKFDINKMLWMNWEYIKAMAPARFVELGTEALRAKGFAMDNYAPDYISKTLLTAKEKIKQFTDIQLFTAFYFVNEVVFSDEVKAKELTPPVRQPLTALRNAYAAMQTFDAK
ncbi:MAG: Glutamate--tRNA ligase, partial [Verrucomicrobiales bacterium]|nr:Glutamate--tRNA ligase [Verrucomicrobiales bacterium]